MEKFNALSMLESNISEREQRVIEFKRWVVHTQTKLGGSKSVGIRFSPDGLYARFQPVGYESTDPKWMLMDEESHPDISEWWWWMLKADSVTGEVSFTDRFCEHVKPHSLLSNSIHKDTSPSAELLVAHLSNPSLWKNIKTSSSAEVLSSVASLKKPNTPPPHLKASQEVTRFLFALLFVSFVGVMVFVVMLVYHIFQF